MKKAAKTENARTFQKFLRDFHTQQEAATFLGCSVAAVSMMKTGMRPITARTAAMIEEKTNGEYRREDLISWG